MSLEQTPIRAGEAFDVQHPSYTHIRPDWLLFARVLWLICIVLILGAFVTLLPAYYIQLQTVCSGAICLFEPLSPIDMRALQGYDLSVSTYALFIFALTIAVTLACCLVSTVISWRKSDDWLGLLVSLVLIALGTTYVTYDLQLSQSPWQLLALVLNIFTFGLVFVAFSLFPDGRFVPHWSRWIAVGWSIWCIIFLLFHTVPLAQVLHNLVWLLFMASMVVVQTYRYRHVSTSRERQQTKWVVYGISVTVLIVIALKAPAFLLLFVGQHNALYDLVSGPGFIVNLLLFPVAVSIAILRYRLWDIDVIIRRTLVYGSLTVLLAVLYFSLIFVLQFLLQGLFEKNNAIIVVISTLAIAALFQPLRYGIQRGIDRRFYRRKYDAAKTVEAFSATLRNEVDLDQLREHLLNVVQDTMQPSHISLWLREPDRKLPRPDRMLPM